MKYGDREIKSAVVINGTLYEPFFDRDLSCKNCQIPSEILKCSYLCFFFGGGRCDVIFRRLENSQFLNLQEDEKG